MTSNQIAAAQERELERHNAIIEQETGRHNEQMENIQTEANEITNRYQTRKNELEDWYNRAYIDYLNASSDRKLDLEEDLNKIKQQQADNERDYKFQMAQLEGDKNTYEKAYKEAMVQVSQMANQLEERRIDYERLGTLEKEALTAQEMTNAQVRAQLNASIEERKVAAQELYNQQKYFIDLGAQQLQYYLATFEAAKANASIDKMRSEMIGNYVNSATKALDAVSSLPF
jgi:hypothetical protein